VSSQDQNQGCDQADLLEQHALSALSPADGAAVAAHLTQCSRCQAEYDGIRSTVRALSGWPATELRAPPDLWNRLAKRIGNEGWSAVEDELPLPEQWPDLDWETPAPGIYCKILSTDSERRRVSMLVRLDPNTEYPPHTHAGLEELHLLDGELWIDDRKLYPGDYNCATPGTSDARVWSETGCSCVLITSPDDILR
jgi:anti-sigma factor ChrR (cupin superfamily)